MASKSRCAAPDVLRFDLSEEASNQFQRWGIGGREVEPEVRVLLQPSIYRRPLESGSGTAAQMAPTLIILFNGIPDAALIFPAGP